MAIFLVALDEPSEQIFKDTMRLAYPSPKSYEHTPTLFFVQDDNIPDAIAKKLKIKVDIEEEDRLAFGIVFRLEGSYSGYTDRALWDWLTLSAKHE